MLYTLHYFRSAFNVHFQINLACKIKMISISIRSSQSVNLQRLWDSNNTNHHIFFLLECDLQTSKLFSIKDQPLKKLKLNREGIDFLLKKIYYGEASENSSVFLCQSNEHSQTIPGWLWYHFLTWITYTYFNPLMDYISKD